MLFCLVLCTSHSQSAVLDPQIIHVRFFSGRPNKLPDFFLNLSVKFYNTVVFKLNSFLKAIHEPKSFEHNFSHRTLAFISL